MIGAGSRRVPGGQRHQLRSIYHKAFLDEPSRGLSPVLQTEIFRCPMSALGVRRDKAALSSGCKSHPANAPAGSSRSSYGGDEVAEAFGKRVTNW
jgi:hypothetical protein